MLMSTIFKKKYSAKFDPTDGNGDEEQENE